MRVRLPSLTAGLLLGGPLLALHPQERDDPPVRHPLPTPEEIAALPPDGGPAFNRLVFEKSPYLLQHARNPVDWYPWGDEAFRAALAQDKPIFLSIGYSTCHWCHVMEHESFEDPDVAALLNESFVCIKVDREERPDLDHVYMTVTQAMTGRGGWPMTVVMTPQKQPFFAGTYFPRAGRYGRPGMTDLVPRLAEVWKSQRTDVLNSAAAITQRLSEMVAGDPGTGLEPGVLDRAASTLAQQFDTVHGGFGDAPKFPVPHNLRLLLRRWQRTGEGAALGMVEKTLSEMRRGGIWDHVGFGFHRYSTDAEWLVPHFEKMLYDQALLALAYTEAWQATGKSEFRETASGILEYVRRDMTSPEGGFYSAEDADSEGEEGKFYLWTAAELRDALGEHDADLAMDVFGVAEAGNYRDEASGERTGGNILHQRESPAESARRRGEPLEEFAAHLESIRRRLFAVREVRIHPLKDDKVLTDWNGLMIAAYALAGRAFDEPAHTAIARRAGEHLLTRLRRPDGSLFKLARLGVAAGDGLLEDYAYAAWGLLELYETTQEPRWLGAAIELTERAVALFHDAQRGGFYLAPADSKDLIVRPKDAYDGAQPSGNSVAALNLLRLGRMTGETRWDELAQGVFGAFAGDVMRNPVAYSQMLAAYGFALGPTYEVVVAGDPAAEDVRELLRGVQRAFAPDKVVQLRPASGPDEVVELVELAEHLEALVPVEGKVTVYVCRNFACQEPVHTLEEVLRSLGVR